MTALQRAAACAGMSLLAMTGTLHGGEPLRMQVTPAMSRAPAFVTVRVTLTAAADDRMLRIVAESPDFYRSSEIQIDGASGPPLSVFQFRDLPPGLYRVTGTLVGVHGTRATAGTLLNVQPTFGTR